MQKEKKMVPLSLVRKEIGERIRWVREILNVNQAELARIMGVDPSVLHRIEKGERPPSVFFVIALTNRFDLSSDYVLRGRLTGKENPELQMQLAARHPELILGRESPGKDTGRVRAACKVEN